MRRDPEGLLERSGEVGFGDVAHPRQPPDRPRLVRGGVHPVLGPKQASQQLGVLVGGTSAHALALAFHCASRSAISSARRGSSRPSRMLRSSASARR